MMNQADPIMQCRRTITAFFVRPIIALSGDSSIIMKGMYIAEK